MIENEAKFRLDDRNDVLKRLRALKAVCGKRQREVDFVFDTAQSGFAAAGKLIRLRTGAAGCLITFKGPCMPGRFKKRHEVNIPCPGGEAEARSALASLGLRGCFAKEKYRQPWRYGRVLICLDTLPLLGDFLEIEGRSADISAAARALGLDPRRALKESYEALFGRLCAGLAARCPHMLKQARFSFAFERKARKKKWL